MKQLALALHNYESAHGRLPPLMGGGATALGADDFFIAGGSTKYPEVRGPIHVSLLPFIEQDTLYKSMLVETDKGKYYSAAGSNVDSPPFKKAIPQLISPSDPSHRQGLDSQGRGITSYSANAQLFANTNRQGLITGELTGTSNQFDRGLQIANIKDGSSNTIAFAEKYGQCGDGGSLWSAGIADRPVKAIPTGTKDDPYYWPIFALASAEGTPAKVYAADPKSLANPDDSRILFQLQPDYANAASCDPLRASTPYSSGILVSMADGSVRTVTKSITPQIWFYGLHPEDGEKYSFDQ